MRRRAQILVGVRTLLISVPRITEEESEKPLARIENHKYSIEEAFRNASTLSRTTNVNTYGRIKKFNNSSTTLTSNSTPDQLANTS